MNTNIYFVGFKPKFMTGNDATEAQLTKQRKVLHAMLEDELLNQVELTSTIIMPNFLSSKKNGNCGSQRGLCV